VAIFVSDWLTYKKLIISFCFKKVKNIDTKPSNKRNNQNSKDETIT